MQSTSEVLYTTVFDEKAKQHLADGKKVVLCPKPSKVKVVNQCSTITLESDNVQMASYDHWLSDS